MFPKVFSVELCHVIAIYQVTSNLLPLHLAHLCFSTVCVCWSFTTSVANHYLVCSFRVRSLEDLSPEHWELGGVLGVAVVTAWQGVGRLERAEEVKRTTTSLPGKNLSFIWSGIMSPANCHNLDLIRRHDLGEECKTQYQWIRSQKWNKLHTAWQLSPC